MRRMFRIVNFIALFGYLNILCFEVRSNDVLWSFPVEASETIVEVVLEEVLDLEQHHSAEILPNIIFDDYRADFPLSNLIPFVLVFCWVFSFIISELRKPLNNPFYLSRVLCRPGYYRFLYRYRPF